MKWFAGSLLLLLVGTLLRLELLVYAMYVLLGIMVLSRFVARSWMAGIEVRRDCGVETTALGSQTEIALTVTNRGRLDVAWVLIEEALSVTDLTQRPARLRVRGPRTALSRLRPGETVTLRYTIEFLMRGYYQLGPTLLDETEDASGAGLLQAAGHAGKDAEPATEAVTENAVEHKARRLSKSPAALFELQAAVRPRERVRRCSRRVKRAPGVWVIYFSLAALPLFGVGQVLLAKTAVGARGLGFGLLILYLTAALGLLLSTSFLGLRRYLRQRRIAMPGNIAGKWLTAGGGLAVAVLALATLAPRPRAGAAWASLAYQIDRKIEQASAWATRLNPGARGESAVTEEGGAESGDSRRSTGSGGQGPGEGPGRNESPAGRLVDSAVSSLQGAARAAQSLLPTLRFLVYLTLAMFLIWWLFRRRRFLLELWWALYRVLSRFWSGLSARTGPRARRPQSGTANRVRSKPFAAFRNPFLRGLDRQWPPERLIVYSFDALKAWSREADHQTPREFCRVVAESYPEMEDGALNLAVLYGHTAYGRRAPDLTDTAPLQRLWSLMGEASPPR